MPWKGQWKGQVQVSADLRLVHPQAMMDLKTGIMIVAINFSRVTSRTRNRNSDQALPLSAAQARAGVPARAGQELGGGCWRPSQEQRSRRLHCNAMLREQCAGPACQMEAPV